MSPCAAAGVVGGDRVAGGAKEVLAGEEAPHACGFFSSRGVYTCEIVFSGGEFCEFEEFGGRNVEECGVVGSRSTCVGVLYSTLCGGF